jgi:nicotinamide mononucleotide (NMN) deamidase PncC
MRAIAIALSLAVACSCTPGIARAAVIKVPRAAVASDGSAVTPAFFGKLIRKAKSSVGRLARKP